MSATVVPEVEGVGDGVALAVALGDDAAVVLGVDVANVPVAVTLGAGGGVELGAGVLVAVGLLVGLEVQVGVEPNRRNGLTFGSPSATLAWAACAEVAACVRSAPLGGMIATTPMRHVARMCRRVRG